MSACSGTTVSAEGVPTACPPEGRTTAAGRLVRGLTLPFREQKLQVWQRSPPRQQAANCCYRCWELVLQDRSSIAVSLLIGAGAVICPGHPSPASDLCLPSLLRPKTGLNYGLNSISSARAVLRVCFPQAGSTRPFASRGASGGAGCVWFGRRQNPGGLYEIRFLVERGAAGGRKVLATMPSARVPFLCLSNIWLIPQVVSILSRTFRWLFGIPLFSTLVQSLCAKENRPRPV